MSLPRFLIPSPPSQMTVRKFVLPMSSNPPCTCSCAPRSFTTSQHPFNSSKRKLQTATAYRPQSLEPAFIQAPRNTGIPETSIATSIPQVNNIRPPTMIYRQRHSQDKAQSLLTMSLGEGEAQQSISKMEVPAQEPAPCQEPSSTQPSNPELSRPKRQSKLRPRKAAMTITSQAVAQLRRLLQQPEPKMIRVSVKNRGCSGLAYHLEYVDKPGTFDEKVEQEGVEVFIDSKALFSIIGSEMHWVNDRLSQRFVFRNPNISESFSLA